MRRLLWFLTVYLSLATLALGEPQTGRFLYLSMPDGAQQEGRSGTGILVFDVDDEHKLVRRIDIPIFKEGLRGFTGSAKTHCVLELA